MSDIIKLDVEHPLGFMLIAEAVVANCQGILYVLKCQVLSVKDYLHYCSL